MDEHSISDYMMVTKNEAVVTAMFPYRENGVVKLQLVEDAIRSAVELHGQPDSPIGDKELALVLGKATQLLRDAEKGWLEKVIGKIVPRRGNDKPVSFYKSSQGVYRWMATYSNKYLDDDRPVREIISSQSHKAFTKMVELGVVKPPELWLWHNPLWKIGEAEWVAYDDNGFAIAGGYVYPEHNDIIDHIKTLPDLAMSHGMPRWSVRRDPDQAHVITSHITEELSVLTRKAAANKLTQFAIIGGDPEHDEETNNMVDPNTRRMLVEEMGVPEDLLASLEASNAGKADLADQMGLPSKQVGDAEVEATVNETVIESVFVDDEEIEVEITDVTETPTDVPSGDEKSIGSAVNEQLVASIVKIAGVITEQNERIAQLAKQVDALTQAEEVRLTQKMVATPLASAMALMERSAVGHEATQVDGRTKLGKSAPEETEYTSLRPSTGIPFVDQLIHQDNSRGG